MSLTYSKIEEMPDIQVGQLQVKQTESTSFFYLYILLYSYNFIYACIREQLVLPWLNKSTYAGKKKLKCVTTKQLLSDRQIVPYLWERQRADLSVYSVSAPTKTKFWKISQAEEEKMFSLFWKRKIIIKNNQCEVTKEDYTNTALNKCNESSGQSLTSMLLFIRPLASAKSGCLVLIYASSMATKLCTWKSIQKIGFSD